MSALPPKADILGRYEKGLLLTQSGHCAYEAVGRDGLTKKNGFTCALYSRQMISTLQTVYWGTKILTGRDRHPWSGSLRLSGRKFIGLSGYARQLPTASSNCSDETGLARTQSAPRAFDVSRTRRGAPKPPPEIAMIFVSGDNSLISVMVL